MKLPLSWLKEYVDFADTAKGLADKLSFAGVEVEGIARLGGGVPGADVQHHRGRYADSPEQLEFSIKWIIGATGLGCRNRHLELFRNISWAGLPIYRKRGGLRSAPVCAMTAP